MYQARVREMITDGKDRLIISINDLRKKNPQRARQYVCIYHLTFVLRILDKKRV